MTTPRKSDSSSQEICDCCGADSPDCRCEVRIVDDEDTSVGYHAEILWCFTHRRMAE